MSGAAQVGWCLLAATVSVALMTLNRHPWYLEWRKRRDERLIMRSGHGPLLAARMAAQDEAGAALTDEGLAGLIAPRLPARVQEGEPLDDSEMLAWILTCANWHLKAAEPTPRESQ